MPEVIQRAQWDGNTGDRRRFSRSYQVTRVRGVALHYPGDGGDRRAGMSLDATCALLRGFRDYHRRVRGWPDIGYNLLVDQAGRLYEGAGARIAAHSAVKYTYPQGNHEWVGLQIIIGDQEKPTDEARETVAWVRSALVAGTLGRHLPGWAAMPGAHDLSAHKLMPGASTQCPGAEVIALIARGGFNVGSVSRDDDRPVLKPEPGVERVQRLLHEAGFYGGLVDGIRGPRTVEAIGAYQKGQLWPRLVADGVWGPVTDAHAAWTGELQEALNGWKSGRPDLRVDRDYGDMTFERVREWQSRNQGGAYRGAVDGQAGPVTAKALRIRAHP